MRKGMFDYNGDGKLDVYERAAEMEFIDEVILGEDEHNQHEVHSAGKQKGEITGISFMGKPLYDARKDSDGVKILKSLGVLASIFGGFAIPIATDMGDLGMILFMFLGIGLGVLILKNT